MTHNYQVTLTWLDVNSWRIETHDQRILLDPWLIGDLVFGDVQWFFKGVRPQPLTIPTDIDLILLSQGLPDHAHPETLKALDKQIPVIASPSAAKVCRELGFETVTALEFGQTFEQGDQFTIKALPGAPLGPLAQENAYLITFKGEGPCLYYGPHGYPSTELKTVKTIDVAITPIESLKLPLLGPVIRGAEGALELAKMVNPQLLLSTASGGDVIYEGLLASLLRSEGGIEQLRSQLAEAGLKTEVKTLKPGLPFALDLR